MERGPPGEQFLRVNRMARKLRGILETFMVNCTRGPRRPSDLADRLRTLGGLTPYAFLRGALTAIANGPPELRIKEIMARALNKPSS